MKHTRLLCWFVALSLAGALLRTEAATTIVLDSFTNPDGTTGTDLENRTPEDINVPGNLWLRAGFGLPAGSLATDGGRAVAFPQRQIRTFLNGLNASTALTVNATLRYEQSVATANSFRRGAAVGFSSGGPTEQAGFFVGIALGPTSETNPDLSLKLIHNVNDFNHNGMVAAQIAYTGTRTNLSDYHDLEYVVDTVSGNLLDVVLDGEHYNFATNVTFFSAAKTPYFAFYNDINGDAGAEGYFDFVQLGLGVPEPTAMTMIALAAGLMWFRRKP